MRFMIILLLVIATIAAPYHDTIVKTRLSNCLRFFIENIGSLSFAELFVGEVDMKEDSFGESGIIDPPTSKSKNSFELLDRRTMFTQMIVEKVLHRHRCLNL